MKPIENSVTTKVFKLAGGNADTDLPVEPWNSDTGTRVHTSYWVPSEGELVQLEDGATIALSVWGLVHPPVALGIGPALDPAPPKEHAVLGVPTSEIAAITLDGCHWLEVLGTIFVSALDQSDPFEGPALIFKVAQAPGGKTARSQYGIAQGDTVVVAPHRVVGFTKKPGLGERTSAAISPNVSATEPDRTARPDWSAPPGDRRNGSR